LEVLAKAMEAGHTAPDDPEAATGAPLRKEDLEGALKVKVAACKSKADWMKALEASGLEKAEFEKGLSKADMGRYQKAMNEDYEEEGEEEAEKARKSLELEALEAEIGDLEAQLEKGSDDLETFDDDVFDDPEIRDLEQVDVSGFIKSLTDASRHGFRSAVAGNEALRKMIELQGKLTTRLAKSLVESRRSQLELMDEVRDLKKSMTELGESPAMRRGATTITQAEAIERFQKGEGDTPKGFVKADPFAVGAAFKKSMEDAERVGDSTRLSRLSMASIQWSRAKNAAKAQGNELMLMPQGMAELINYAPQA
jgi:hypothetical protein